MSKNDYAVVMTACANTEDARPVIDALLSKKLAACIQLLPITSYYTWKGKVNKEGETLLLIKCRGDRFKAIKEEILRLHKYELPEIIQIPIVDGLEPYLKWIDNPE